MAIRLKISQPAYVKCERQERKGKIKLETLVKVADAMGCELIYGFRPKRGVRFSETVWGQIVEPLALHLIENSAMYPRELVLAKKAYETMMDVDSRRRNEWTQRRPSPE
jgi:hypothetical protein